MSEQIEYLDPNKIKPDPNQPRDEFDEEKVKQIAQTYDVQDIINPIEVDQDNVIVLGERRWRAAKLKKLTRIPVRRKTVTSQRVRYERQATDDSMRENLSAVQRVWLYATMIANINEDANYTIDDIKEMYKNDYDNLLDIIGLEAKGGRGLLSGQAQLSRTIGISQPTISQYMNFFDMREEIRKIFIENGSKGERSKKVTISHMAEISRLSKYPAERKRLEDLFLEDFSKSKEERKYRTIYDLRDHATDVIKAVEKAVEERVKEIIEQEKKTPKTVVPEPPDVKPLEETIEKEAKRIASKPPKRSPKEIAQSSLTGRGGVKSKIDKAKKMDIDVGDFEWRFETAVNMIDTDLDAAWAEAKKIKSELNNIIKVREQSDEQKKAIEKAREEERKKAEADARRKLEEEKKRLQEIAQQRAQKALDSPEETEKMLLWNATEGLPEGERKLLEKKAAHYNWRATSVKKLIPTLLSFEEPIRIMLLDENYDIGYRIIEMISEVPRADRQVDVIEFLKRYSVDGKKAETIVQEIIDGTSIEAIRKDQEKAPMGVAERYAKNIENTFYNILRWGVETMKAMGPDMWNDHLGYIRGIRIVCDYLERLNPHAPDEKQPSLPALPGITLDEQKIKQVDVEYKVVE